MDSKKFKLKSETLKRCKVVKIEPSDVNRLVPISLEFFSFLYQTKAINFSIYFRIDTTLVEFMKPDELSKELLDDMWMALQKNFDDLSICILRRDRPKFDAVIESVRISKMDELSRKLTGLDQKTLDLYGSISSMSQLIVQGGIDSGVAERVKASAAYLVSNVVDSDASIDTLSRMITCDPTLYDHSATVAMLATVISTRLLPKPLSPKEAEHVAQCALYHDVGKTCVPNHILNKPGAYTPEEFAVMKTHTTSGHEELIKAIKAGAPIAQIAARVALEHHEKIDGKGYPLGRKGKLEDDKVNGIHLYTRIVTISDIYSALLMKRVYKPAYEPQDAVKIMAEMSPGLDPDIFPVFLRGVVGSLNNHQQKMHGKGRILTIDPETGHLMEHKKVG